MKLRCETNLLETWNVASRIMLTLCTRYTALDKSGEVDRLAALHDLAEIPAVTEDEIRGAIEELKRSTDAISKQTETLRQQQDALSRLVKKTAESDARRQEFEHARQRRSESERKRIAAEVSPDGFVTTFFF